MKEKLPNVFTPSRLFIYYNERALEGSVDSDAGAQIRDGIKVVASEGNCPETLWPYDPTKFTEKPSPQCYTDALQHKAMLYQRLPCNINSVKACLASGYPVVFGITLFDSFESDEVTKTGIVPMPQVNEPCLGGHAVMIVGYDDSTHRLLVRNSWGTDWGMAGYFTLPYLYLDPSLADDLWTIKAVR
jgi:C1A family cysteine protease